MPDGAEFQRSFADTIAAKRPERGLPPAFAVYRNTWLKGLLDALGANFPTIAMILGPEAFRAVGLEYARDHPPETPVLALYGGAFPDFLARHALGRDIPYLRDVAALERLWTECFFAPDAPALEGSYYATVQPTELVGLRPRLHSATRFERFETPAVTIWQAHRAAGEFEGIEPDWKAEHALVTRRGMSVAVKLIDEPTHRLLAAIKRDEALGLAIAATAKAHPICDLGEVIATIISSAALAAPPIEDDRIW